jgi:sialate O-acetylesterase
MRPLRAGSAVTLLAGALACSQATGVDDAPPRVEGRRQAAILAAATSTLAVSPIFRANMVLQRDVAVPVFGKADPATTVTVQFQGQSVATVAAADGTWRVDLASMPANRVPNTLTVSAGSTTAQFTGVLVGDVWLCSGQSNMGKPLSFANGGSAEAGKARNHDIRLFRMTAQLPGPSYATWQVSDSAAASTFSAVGYWFGLELAKQHSDVPVGLIQATHDGTSISRWQTSNEGSGADYIAMVKAIQPFAVKGVVWYQGESDGGDATYEKRLTDMIAEWRGDWAQARLPFGIVQLTGSGSGGARWGQYLVSRRVADTWLVVTSDLPGGQQLHPTEKKPIGLRLGLGARALVHGEPIEYSGPVVSGVTVSGSRVTLAYAHAGSRLVTGNGAAPATFQIAAAPGGRYQTATATIVGNTVVLTSKVAAPRSVRYQWGSIGNLFNAISVPVEGGTSSITRLPASLVQVDF